MTTMRDLERWRARTPLLLTPKGELQDPGAHFDPSIPSPRGWILLRPSKLFFRCYPCPFCRLHIRRENLLQHFKKHDATRDRQRLRDAGVGNQHRTLPGQMKLNV